MLAAQGSIRFLKPGRSPLDITYRHNIPTPLVVSFDGVNLHVSGTAVFTRKQYVPRPGGYAFSIVYLRVII